jgi:nucleotide-binding universal stress UspA family protein
MIALKKILVATDFGDASDSALRYGRVLTRSFNGELYVLHVVDNQFTRAMDFYGHLAIPLENQDELEESLREQTEALLDEEDRRDLHARAVMTTGSPAEAIVEYARAHAIDLIVMGTHGREGVGHLLMGSTAERVVRRSPCPVLTLHHPEHEFVAPDALVAVTRP